MGSSLGPLTANTLMCSIEEKLAHENKLHNFVDDTSALVPDLTALTSFFRGPRPAAAQSWFSTVFCPAVNPHTCTDLNWVWACNLDDGEFEFVWVFNRLTMHFLYIGFCQQTSKRRMHLFHLTTTNEIKKGSKRIQMIIKMVTEFKLAVVTFARPNKMQICACAWIFRWTKKLRKIRTGLPGRWAVAGRGPATSKTRSHRRLSNLQWNSLLFEGMVITKTDNHINTSVYRKKTNKVFLLHYQSHVDNRYKLSLIY